MLLAEEAGDLDQVKQEIQKEAENKALEEAKGAEAAESEDSDAIDNEEDGGEWVTSKNLYSHIGGVDANNLMENQDNLLFTQIVDGQDRKENPETEEETKTEAQPEGEAPKTDVASPFAAPVV